MSKSKIAEFSKGKYTFTVYLVGKKLQFKLDDGWRSDWPIFYPHTGKVGFDTPEMFPKSIIAWATKKVRLFNGRA